MIRQDMEEVRRLLQETLSRMGVSPDQMRELQDELRRRLGDAGLSDLFSPPDAGLPPPDDIPLDDRPSSDIPLDDRPQDDRPSDETPPDDRPPEAPRL
jgi:hypothetical protein